MQAQLPTLVHGLNPGDEVELTENGRPLARIIPAETPVREPRRPARCAAQSDMAPDFDVPLEDFKEYME